MICPECGLENAENAELCAGCGKKLKDYGKDFALASLVLGILSMLIFPYLYAPLSILAAVFAKKQRYTGKMATIGIVLSLVAFAGWLIIQIINAI